MCWFFRHVVLFENMFNHYVGYTTVLLQSMSAFVYGYFLCVEIIFYDLSLINLDTEMVCG